MIETSNLKHIKEKSKAVMIYYQFVSYDLLTFLKYAPLNSLWTLLTYILTSDLLTYLNTQHRDWIFRGNSHVYFIYLFLLPLFIHLD